MIEWLSNYSDLTNIIIALFNLFATIITAFLFLGILGLTWWYSKSTRDIAKKTSESVEITKKKEKIDRAQNYIDKSERIRLPFLNLTQKKNAVINNNPPMIDLNNIITWDEIRDIIIFFNRISTLIKLDKINEELIETEMGSSMRSFIRLFYCEIPIIIDKLNPNNTKRYDLSNYFNYCLESNKKVKFFNKEEIKWVNSYIDKLNNLK